MGSFLIGAVCLLATGYFAMIYENPRMMLLVYLQLVLAAVALVVVLYRKFTVKGELDIPVGLTEPGKDTLVKLTLHNKGLLPVLRAKALIVVEDVYFGKKKKRWMKLGEVSRGESSLFRSVAFSGAGLYRVRLKKLRVYDLTGLFHCSIRCKSEKQIQILPELYDVPVRMSMAVRNFYGESDVYDEHRPGHDNSELFQIREYRKGDRLQNIHWKLTAKQDDIMVKEHSLPKACPVVLFLEYHPRRRETKEGTLFAFLEIGASISFSLMDAGCPHFVVWYDDSIQDICRVRVDNEESLFYVIGTMMRNGWKAPKEPLADRYREKFRSEPLLSVTESSLPAAVIVWSPAVRWTVMTNLNLCAISAGRPVTGDWIITTSTLPKSPASCVPAC